ncbi:MULTISPECIES: hypothetical protein [Exiguobacterium]|uniref:hypothetical protein n=1 Tax=Exiguobacterium TaxID=33986 RepID=UPI001AE1F818|nr:MULTISPECIES: hypothetical protein [Exiguobacterium]MCT4779837.1 hypothetical protein [Exiguobacterium soli]
MSRVAFVRFNMRSGKRHDVDIPVPDTFKLNDLIEDIEHKAPVFLEAGDSLSIRWSEVESLEDVSNQYGETKPNETETSADKAKRISDIAFDLLSEKGFSPSKDELLVLAYKHL